ncbi:MAG: hypothetical protein K2Q01_10710, partial [Rickettsiales bacterium]|nr:hypothetical protein [Rickettsiales bacterium]
MLNKARDTAALELIETNVLPVLEKKQKLLDSLIDPRKADAPKALTPEMRKGMGKAISARLLGFALKDGFTDGVVNPDKTINNNVYRKKLDAISDGLVEAMKEQGSPLTENGMRAIANEAAAEFLNKQAGGIATPAIFKDTVLVASREAAALEIIDLNVGPALESQKKRLNSLIDPRKVPPGKQPPEEVTADQLGAMRRQMASSLLPFALDENFTNGVMKTEGDQQVVNPLVYGDKHSKLSDAILAKLEADPQNPLSRKGMIALSNQAAAEFLNKQLGLEAMPGFMESSLQESQKEAAKDIVYANIRPALEAKKKLLEGMIDPDLQALQAKSNPKLSFTNVELDRQARWLSAALTPFAMQEDFLNGVSDPQTYADKHSKLSDGIFATLKEDNSSLFTDAGKRAFADNVAAEYIEKQTRIKPPPEVVKRMEDSTLAAAEDIVGRSLLLELKGPDTTATLTMGNGGKAVNVEVAAKAVKKLAAKRMLDTDGFKTLDAKGYDDFMRDVRMALESKRAEMGVAAGAEGDALLDVMAFKISTGMVDKVLEGKGPPVPNQQLNRKTLAEGVIAKRLVPDMVREALLPKLRGTVSVTDNTEDPDNLVIANLLALDAARIG